jgi:predicted exporter
MKEAAQGLDFVYFINKTGDIEKELDKLTKVMLTLFAAAFIIIALSLCFVYSVREILQIFLVPAIITLAILAILAACHIPLGLFPMTGLLMVFGLGLDYIFFIKEDHDGPAKLAVFLSFATTALSFGALALTGFPPAHIFGITVFAGISAAYITANLLPANLRDKEE